LAVVASAARIQEKLSFVQPIHDKEEEHDLIKTVPGEAGSWAQASASILSTAGAQQAGSVGGEAPSITRE
jgi:hypothetical protein